MTKKITFYIGLNDKDTRKQQVTEYQVQMLLDKVFDSYMIYVASGRYKYIDNTVEKETTLVVTYFDFTNKITKQVLKNICRYLKSQLNQESILVEITNNDVQLI